MKISKYNITIELTCLLSKAENELSEQKHATQRNNVILTSHIICSNHNFDLLN